MIREPVTSVLIHLRTECYLIEHALSTDIEVAVLETDFFCGSCMFIDLERWDITFREYLCTRDDDLYGTGGDFQILLSCRASTDYTRELHDILRAECICDSVSLSIFCRIIDRLCDTISVTQIDEDESSMIATIRDPA